MSCVATSAVTEPVAVPAAIAVGTAVQGTAVQATEPKAAAAFNPSALNQPGEWDFFLSHTQRDDKVVVLAEVLCNQFEKMGARAPRPRTLVPAAPTA